MAAAASPSGISASGTVSASAGVTPIYGIPKIRVGVQTADGAYVRDGTTTAGSAFTIVETGPGVAQQPGGKVAYTCTTGGGTLNERQLSVCPGNFTGSAGDTFTVTQTAAQPGYVVNPIPVIVGPCERPAVGQYCSGSPQAQDVIISDDVVPPTATDDATTVDNTARADVAVLTNDDTQGAPILSLEVTDPAGHGTAVVSTDDPFHIQYTPTAGYLGTDSFGYRYTTVNGSANGTVTVTVTGDPLPPTATDDETTVDNTGSVDVDVLSNDDPQGAPVLSLEVSGAAAHGTAVVSTDDPGHIRYTPAPGFVGADSFAYTYTTASGSATGTVTVTVTAPVAPIYGSQKVRVGVQIASGAYVPDAATTTGSTVTIVESGPGAPRTLKCTTGPTDPGSTISHCPDSILVSPGDTLTLSQDTAGAGLVLDPNSIVVPPCAQVFFPTLDSAPPSCGVTDAIFTDAGLAPTATDDAATVDNTASADVAVLANDQTQGAPVLSVEVSNAADHGTAVVMADDPDHRVRYTPAAGYVGTDSFDYTYTTANGSAAATVTLTITGSAPTLTPTPSVEPTTTVITAPTATVTTTTPGRGGLASTGAPPGAGLGAALGLLLSGAGMSLLRRRRGKTPGRHV